MIRSILIPIFAAISAFAPVAARAAALDDRIQTFIEKSLPRLACNLSVGDPGSIIAAPEKKDPNYYYHWVRDSALVVQTLARLIPYVRGTATEKSLHQFIGDFVVFSNKLQQSPTKQGDGEVRFNVDGSVDETEWPRPQHDGPALRALALITYLGYADPNASRNRLIESVIRRDLASVVKRIDARGFDLWEYSNGFHFHTRMVQRGACAAGRPFRQAGRSRLGKDRRGTGKAFGKSLAAE